MIMLAVMLMVAMMLPVILWSVAIQRSLTTLRFAWLTPHPTLHTLSPKT